MTKPLSKKASKHLKYVLMDIKNATIADPIKSKTMELRYGIGGVTIREIVHYLRAYMNEPICSDANGYFYPQSKFEANHTIAQLKSRVKEIMKVVKGIEGYFGKESQGSLL